MWISASSIPRRLAALFLLSAAAVGLYAQEAQTSFDWAFVKRAANGSPVPVAFKERVTIVPGDLFKIYVKPLRGAYVYLFLYDAQGDLQMLFPGSFADFDARAYLAGSTFIPGGEQWFTLDGAKGTERFYLVASSQRLKGLETCVTSCDKASPGAKAAARQAVLDEIARVRREHSQLTMAAEKPVTVAGGTRGINTAIQQVATRIDAPGFYYKLFRLDH